MTQAKRYQRKRTHAASIASIIGCPAKREYWSALSDAEIERASARFEAHVRDLMQIRKIIAQIYAFDSLVARALFAMLILSKALEAPETKLSTRLHQSIDMFKRSNDQTALLKEDVEAERIRHGLSSGHCVRNDRNYGEYALCLLHGSLRRDTCDMARIDMLAEAMSTAYRDARSCFAGCEHLINLWPSVMKSIREGWPSPALHLGFW